MFHTILSRCLTVSSKIALPLRWYSTQIDFKTMINNNKIVVFMKGVPDKPRCGYSNTVIQILKLHGLEFDAHDVLDDWDLRQGIKEFSNWPTIPQVFIDGQFVGGADTLTNMHKNGELLELLEKAGIVSEFKKKKGGKESN